MNTTTSTSRSPDIAELRERAADITCPVLRARVEGRIAAALQLRQQADTLLLKALQLCPKREHSPQAVLQRDALQ